jgi:hypothetical protein
MQQTRIQQGLHQRLDAADRHQLGHRIAAARAQIREHRHALADAREIIELELHLGDEAIASRCSTALVEPPSAMTTVIAFSKALRVMIWRGKCLA